MNEIDENQEGHTNYKGSARIVLVRHESSRIYTMVVADVLLCEKRGKKERKKLDGKNKKKARKSGELLERD